MPSDNASQKNSEQNYMSYEEYLQKVKTGILTDSGNCPVTPLLKMLQGKWKTQVLYEFCIYDTVRFGVLKKRSDRYHKHHADKDTARTGS